MLSGEERAAEEPILEDYMGASQEGQEQEEEDEDGDEAAASLGYDPLLEQLKDLGLDKDDDDDKEEDNNVDKNDQGYDDAGQSVGEDGEPDGAAGAASDPPAPAVMAAHGHHRVPGTICEQNALHARARVEQPDDAAEGQQAAAARHEQLGEGAGSAYSAPSSFNRATGSPNGYSAGMPPQQQQPQHMLSGGTSSVAHSCVVSRV